MRRRRDGTRGAYMAAVIEPVVVRSIRFALDEFCVGDLGIPIVEPLATTVTHTAPVGELVGDNPHRANPGTYLHRDDVVKMIEVYADAVANNPNKDEAAQREAVSQLRGLAAYVRTRGAE